MIKLPITVLWAAAILFSLPGYSWSAELLTLDQAVHTALADNEQLAVSQARSAALQEVPTRVGELPDPSLKLNAMNLPVDTFAVGQEAMTQLQVGIGQMFPYPGKLALKVDAAENAANAAVADTGELRQQVTRDVTVTWWRLFYLDRALEIVGRNQDLLRQFVTIARTKYSVGRGLQQDVLLAEVELSKLFDLRLELEGKRDDTAAHLNRLMGWPSGQGAILPKQADVSLSAVGSVVQLAAQADALRPTIAAASQRLKMANSRLALARKQHLPDFMLSAAYGVRSGTNPNGSERPDFASVMLSFKLPIDRDDRRDRLVAQRRLESQSRHSAEQATRDKVLEQIAGAHARYQKARERVRLLKTGIIPQAEQTVASMQAGYQVNKVDFLNLVRAQITLYNYETRYWKTLAAAKGALAKLTAAVGGPVTTPDTKELK